MMSKIQLSNYILKYIIKIEKSKPKIVRIFLVQNAILTDFFFYILLLLFIFGPPTLTKKNEQCELKQYHLII